MYHGTECGSEDQVGTSRSTGPLNVGCFQVPRVGGGRCSKSVHVRMCVPGMSQYLRERRCSCFFSIPFFFHMECSLDNRIGLVQI